MFGCMQIGRIPAEEGKKAGMVGCVNIYIYPSRSSTGSYIKSSSLRVVNDFGLIYHLVVLFPYMDIVLVSSIR